MQVQLVLKEWKVALDSSTKAPKITGNYVIVMGEKEIADRNFNHDYNGAKIPFSKEIVQDVIALETRIKAELQNLI